MTDYEKIRLEYYASRPIIAVIVIDNYDELIRGLTDRKRNELRDAIEDKLLQWCEGKGRLLPAAMTATGTCTCSRSGTSTSCVRISLRPCSISSTA